jgi:catechol 2,3-dioxygenase-like lactoylglutathione lyase family enzyme
MAILAIEHVQLAMPPGGEGDARTFYAGLLGIPEVPKPPSSPDGAASGSRPARSRSTSAWKPTFRPARKAHPALLVRDLRALVERLRAAGVEVRDDPFEGHYRVYVADPFGNRIELLEPNG